MKIRGHDVLISRHSYLSWCRANLFFPDGEPEPEVYPCIVKEHLNSHENPYLSFITLDNVARMEKALQRAEMLISRKKRSGGA